MEYEQGLRAEDQEIIARNYKEKNMKNGQEF
jgi:hypothetical protein